MRRVSPTLEHAQPAMHAHAYSLSHLLVGLIIKNNEVAIQHVEAREVVTRIFCVVNVLIHLSRHIRMPVSLSHTRPGQQHECGRGVISRSMRGSGTLRCVRMLRVRTTNAVPRVSLVFPFRICHQTGKSVGARKGGTTNSPNTHLPDRAVSPKQIVQLSTGTPHVSMSPWPRCNVLAWWRSRVHWQRTRTGTCKTAWA